MAADKVLQLQRRAKLLSGAPFRVALLHARHYLYLSNVGIRLHGIDAPEAKQLCQVKGEAWRCGEAATETLSFLLIGGSIRQLKCRRTNTDNQNRQ